MKPAMAGVSRLSRLIVRQDRLRYFWWYAGIIGMTLVVPPALETLYPTKQDRDTMAETMRNPVMEAMVGPGDLANYTLGAMVSHQMLVMTAIAVAIMNILLMIRHTRAEEEEGQAELVRSLPVERHAQLMASIWVLLLLNVLLALGIGVGLYSLSIDSMGFAGSMVYGASLGATGLFYAGIAAVCAQLAESSRGAVGLSFAIMIGCYLSRSGSEWVPPFGWLTYVQPYSSNRVMPVLALCAAGAVLFAVAMMLHAKRDIGSGLLPSGNGRAHASIFLRSPLGLAWRLQRTTFVFWSIGMLVLGLSYGSVLGDLDAFFQDNELLSAMIVADENHSLTAQFLPMLMAVLAFISTIPALLSLHRIAGEERKSRIDVVLISVSRRKLLGCYFALSVMTAFAMLSFSALGLWLAGTVSMEDPFSFKMVWLAAIVHFPAILVMIGISTCLIGVNRKMVGLVWLYLFYGFLTLYLGGLFQFPEWMEKLSPFGFVAKLPIEEMNWPYAVGLLLVAGVLLVFGSHRYANRDMEEE